MILLGCDKKGKKFFIVDFMVFFCFMFEYVDVLFCMDVWKIIISIRIFILYVLVLEYLV